MKEVLYKLTSFLRTRFFWINALLLIIVLSLIFLAINSYLTSYTRHGENVLVPDLRGQTVGQVQDYLNDKNLNYLVFDSTFVNGKQPLEVLEQDPAPGSKVKEDRRVYLTVNAETAPNVKLPNLKDSSLKDARLQIENKGLELGKIIYRPHPWNVVLEMRQNGKILEPGHELKKGTEIYLVVGDGEGVNTFTMRSLRDLPLDEAIAVIKLSDLTLGKVNRDMLKGGGKGYVDEQDPKAGDKVRKGTPVDLWLKPVSGSDYDNGNDYTPQQKKHSNSGQTQSSTELPARPLDFNNKEMMNEVLNDRGNR